MHGGTADDKYHSQIKEGEVIVSPRTCWFLWNTVVDPVDFSPSSPLADMWVPRSHCCWLKRSLSWYEVVHCWSLQSMLVAWFWCYHIGWCDCERTEIQKVPNYITVPCEYFTAQCGCRIVFWFKSNLSHESNHNHKQCWPCGNVTQFLFFDNDKWSIVRWCGLSCMILFLERHRTKSTLARQNRDKGCS